MQEGEGREGKPIPKGGKLMTRRPQLSFPQQTLEGQRQVSINILGSLEGQGAPGIPFTVSAPELTYAHPRAAALLIDRCSPSFSPPPLAIYQRSAVCPTLCQLFYTQPSEEEIRDPIIYSDQGSEGGRDLQEVGFEP